MSSNTIIQFTLEVEFENFTESDKKLLQLIKENVTLETTLNEVVIATKLLIEEDAIIQSAAITNIKLKQKIWD